MRWTFILVWFKPLPKLCCATGYKSDALVTFMNINNQYLGSTTKVLHKNAQVILRLELMTRKHKEHTTMCTKLLTELSFRCSMNSSDA